METAIKCPNCGATESKKGPFTEAALRVHMNVHCPKKPNKQQSPNTEDNEWVLLNPRIPSHAQALAAGYTRVCTKTGDLD